MNSDTRPIDLVRRSGSPGLMSFFNDFHSLARRRWRFLATSGRPVARWLAAQGAAPRDAVVLLPHVALLAVARAAFAARGGWQPRVETAATLAASLAAPAVPSPGMPSGRPRGRSPAGARRCCVALRSAAPRAIARAFNAVVGAFVQTTQALLQAGANQPPEARAAWWERLRGALVPAAGPGAHERRLARMAVEWAAAADAPATDALSSLEPSAWIVLQAGGIGSAGSAAGRRGARAAAERRCRPDARRSMRRPHCRRRAASSASGLEDEAHAAALAWSKPSTPAPRASR